MSTDNDEAVPDSEPCPSDDARNDPNATDEEATPSQYKKTRCDYDDDEEKANESEEASDESTYQEIIQSIDRDAALKFDCDEFMRRFDVMAEQLKAVMHVQKEHKATKRARGAEMPAPAPKRPALFTPPRKAPISVKATQQRGSEGEESDF
jgi:hypothetical protein